MDTLDLIRKKPPLHRIKNSIQIKVRKTGACFVSAYALATYYAPAAAIFAPTLTSVGSTGIGSRTATGNTKSLPLPQALLRAPVLELARMLEQAFELRVNGYATGSESTGEPATSTFASGFNEIRTWTPSRSAPRYLATESAAGT